MVEAGQEVDLEEQINILTEEVRKKLIPASEKPIEKLKLIDSIQRLGVFYHFEREIDEVLQHFHKNFVHGGIITLNEDLHSLALIFRLLRQQRYRISSATHQRVHGEKTLEEALAFTSAHLEFMASQLSPSIAAKASHSLMRPLGKSLRRLEAWHYISAYQEDPSHDETLLTLAKIDFNALQKQHQKELGILTKWDVSCMDFLPEYMRICYQAVLDVFEEIELETTKEGRIFCVNYAKDELYPSLAWDPWLEDIFKWLTSNPKIVRASTIVTRLMNDIVSNDLEQERGHVSSAVQCYMKEHGVQKQDAIDELKKQVTKVWKDVNEEFLDPTQVPKPLLMVVLNLTRVMDVLYKDGDCHTHSHGSTKNYIKALLLNPVPY
ncbi:hypothetical protein L6164_000616 [Bauhinia variegata]|uniref:Uncharacterized protein n=1 Tax=Bauhinia variegata TaxID=167791 RepID=A0ACB9Q712_BAUVA|nr:hypothetical protein L6164_000616 [Bauhinia variegata]